MDLDPGTVVANRYRILHPLGRGGMGEVFAAENIRTGRHVAVKLLRADSKTKSSAIERFRREARAAGSINSDHVTQVLDVEEDPEHGIVLVFELLEGESLIDRLKRTGPVPFDELHGIIDQVWMGLADAHRAGIIHRDLKPSNVFLERRPDGQVRVKILDFGVSKLPKEMGGETLTEMGQSLGTFSFMPPEQIAKAKIVDHRADIYACATLIYQALSGQLPYSARNILVMVELKNKTDPRTLSEVMDRPADARLEAFLKRGLARDPAERFQSAVEALNAWRDLRPAQAMPASTAAPPTPPPMTPPPMPPPGPPPAGGPRGTSMPPSAPQASSVRPNSYAPQPASANPAIQGYPQAQSAGQGAGEQPMAMERRPRGGTIAMETSFESTAPTKPMQVVSQPPQADSGRLRPVSPSVLPSSNAQWSPMPDPARTAVMANAGAQPYPDPRAAHNSYGPGSYPPPPSPLAQNPYASQAYQSQPPQTSQAYQSQPPQHQQAPSIYDENSNLPPPSQAQTRVYNPAHHGGAAYTSSVGSTPPPMTSSNPSSAPLAPSTPAAMQDATPPQSSSLRVVLWFIAFAVVGFGIVAVLHYLKLF